MAGMRVAAIHVAIPALDEGESLPACLESLAAQSVPPSAVWVCVNQPDAWWADDGKRPICERNLACLAYLRDEHADRVRVIDRASEGRGWQGRQQGVGWARKVLLEAISATADDADVVVWADADARYPAGYLAQVRDLFATVDAAGLLAPYRHTLSGDDALDRAILRYEIYLRYYALNLWRTGTPFAFTAIGSVIAHPVSSHRKLGGLTPHAGGEDFYFAQKLAKYGRLAQWVDAEVLLAARYSERVPLGTGPALRRGMRGDWSRYPLYESRLFDDVAATRALFAELHAHDVETPLSAFLREQLRESDLWGPLRRNHPHRGRFLRACDERVDGLRILQYLHRAGRDGAGRDEDRLRDYVRRHHASAADLPACLSTDRPWTFEALPLAELDAIREFLRERENACRRQHDRSLHPRGAP